MRGTAARPRALCAAGEAVARGVAAFDYADGAWLIGRDKGAAEDISLWKPAIGHQNKFLAPRSIFETGFKLVDQAIHNKIVSFIWDIADDVVRDTEQVPLLKEGTHS